MGSYFDPSTETTKTSDPSKTITAAYDNFDIKFDRTQIMPDETNSKKYYFKTQYSDNKKNNLTYNLDDPAIDKGDYKVTNLYLYGLLHDNISGVTVGDPDFSGELVIEHKKGDVTIYACFLIKSGGASNNFVDRLVKMIDENTQTIPPNPLSTSVSDANISPLINNSAKNDKGALIYKDLTKNNWIIVFLEPLLVTQTTASFIKSKFVNFTGRFDINAPTDVTTISTSNISDNDVNNVLIDCSPAGVSDETVNTYSVPVESEYTNSKVKMDFMKTTMNFYFFMIGIAAAYFILPILYKKLIIDKIVKNGITGTDGGQRLFGADIFITISFIIAAISCISVGESTAMAFGLLFFIIYIFSFPLILLNRKDPAYINGIGFDGVQFEFVNGLKQLFSLIVSMVRTFATTNWKYIYAVMAVITIITLIISWQLYGMEYDKFVKYITSMLFGIEPVVSGFIYLLSA